MGLRALPLANAPEPVHSSGIDGLIGSHFDRAYFIFNLFVDDPRVCLELSDTLFRDLSRRDSACEQEFYGALVSSVRALTVKQDCVAGICAESVLCWILKDSAERSYEQIAALMEFTREQVRNSIAEVRMALLG